MIDGKNSFDQPINSMTKTYKNIRKIATGQGDDYTTGCLLDYSYFKENYKMIAIDLSKQQALDADPRAIQQINCTANLDVSFNCFKRNKWWSRVAKNGFLRGSTKIELKIYCEDFYIFLCLTTTHKHTQSPPHPLLTHILICLLKIVNL